MKTVGRILIILMAVLIVVSATYAIAQTSSAQALVGQPMGLGASEDRLPPNGQNNLAGETNGRPEDSHEGGGLETVGQNLLKITAVIVAVQVLWSIGRRVKQTVALLTRKDRSALSRSV
jgi:hypothetical protein